MAQNKDGGVAVKELADQVELYSVACIHCGRNVFRFSENLMDDSGKVSLVCPSCGGITEVTGGGQIRAG